MAKYMTDEEVRDEKAKWKEQEEILYSNDWNRLKDYVVAYLMSSDKDEEYLDYYPHKEFHDMLLFYQFIFVREDGARMFCQINWNMLEKYGISIEELHDTAMDNLAYQTEFGIGNLDEEIKTITDENTPKFKAIAISNTKRFIGANVVLDAKFMSMVADLLGDQFYLISPSHHEWIASQTMQTHLKIAFDSDGIHR